LEKTISDKEVVNLWRRIRRAVEPKKVDYILGIDGMERLRLFEQVRKREAPSISEPTNLNTYDVHNRITAAAKNFSLITKERLEEIGGDLVWHSTLN